MNHQTKAIIRGRDGVDVEIDATAFRPDWTARWTVERAEKELALFKFKGLGWYLTKGTNPTTNKEYSEAMLVLPAYKTPDQEEPAYLFCVYNHDQASNAFNWIVNAPTRVDER